MDHKVEGKCDNSSCSLQLEAHPKMDLHLPAKRHARRVWPILLLVSFLATVFTGGTPFSWAPLDTANHLLEIVSRSPPTPDLTERALTQQVRFDNFSLFVGDQRVFIQYVTCSITRLGIPLILEAQFRRVPHFPFACSQSMARYPPKSKGRGSQRSQCVYSHGLN